MFQLLYNNNCLRNLIYNCIKILCEHFFSSQIETKKAQKCNLSEIKRKCAFQARVTKITSSCCGSLKLSAGNKNEECMSKNFYHSN